VLRAAGFAPEVLSRIDRIFVFEPLSGLDIARVAALEIESMIQGYGLKISAGGINPQILLDLVDRWRKMGMQPRREISYVAGRGADTEGR
jgi:hypothetical protein